MAHTAETGSTDPLAPEVARLIANKDATGMEVHMAQHGVTDALVAEVAQILQNEGRSTPAY